MTPQLMQLIEETFEYGMTNVHTAFPAVVKSYDGETRRAEIQPSLKRKMSNGKFMELPIIVDVPVLYFGTAKAGIHIPLEEGDEVLIVCSERCLDSWKDAGGDSIEDTDTRRFSMPDAICIPGLQAQTFPNISEKEDCFALHHDEKICITNNKSTVTIENEEITIDNGKATISIDASGNVNIETSGKFTFKNDTTNLKEVLKELKKEVYNLVTTGSQATQQTSPATQALLDTWEQTKLNQLLD